MKKNLSVKRCRACGGAVKQGVHLGTSPIANQLLTTEACQAPVFPLGLVECRDCGLVQNATNLSTHELFGQNYPYFSGTSALFHQHADSLAKKIALSAAFKIAGGNKVLEIGANDGTMQKVLESRGIQTFGIDPAQAPRDQAFGQGLQGICAPMDLRQSQKILDTFGVADLALMTNVLAHVPDPLELLRSTKACLRPGGHLVVEVQSWADLVTNGAFDMIYHEHHSHFSLGAILNLLSMAGFGAYHLEHIAMQGGSLRVWAQVGQSHKADLIDLCHREKIELTHAHEKLHEVIDRFRLSARQFTEKHENSYVCGYGAAAKTVTLLATAGQTLSLTCIADKAPSKIGKYLPVGNLPIVSPETIHQYDPDILILFAWNLLQEIKIQFDIKRLWLPIPNLRAATA